MKTGSCTPDVMVSVTKPNVSSDIYEIYTTTLFNKNRMILEYKVTLLVLKLLNESYIFSLDLWETLVQGKYAFYIFENRVMHTRHKDKRNKTQGKYTRVHGLFCPWRWFTYILKFVAGHGTVVQLASNNIIFGCKRAYQYSRTHHLSELSAGVHKMLNRIGRTCISLLQ